MTHLLDTNTCVEFLRRPANSSIAVKLANAPPGSVVLCSVVVAELMYGAYRSAQSNKTLNQVRAFCSPFASLPLADDAAEQYGRIRAYLDALGMTIGPNDLLIAAIALANQLILVTHNTKEFSRVPGLVIEDWQVP
ncbi:MAG: type II toxin-antitoxin system VapC family toxin [Planctomycetia bacterium]|nr:type II toxin-antitoxin system VapC family toxin [Planctomycetia bacterium]